MVGSDINEAFSTRIKRCSYGDDTNNDRSFEFSSEMDSSVARFLFKMAPALVSLGGYRVELKVSFSLLLNIVLPAGR